MIRSKQARNARAVIREAFINAARKKESDEPYSGDIFTINGQKYVPINYYTDEFGVIQTNLIRYEKRHLADVYIRIRATSCKGQDKASFVREFLAN